jgi:hypothetical protein
MPGPCSRSRAPTADQRRPACGIHSTMRKPALIKRRERPRDSGRERRYALEIQPLACDSKFLEPLGRGFHDDGGIRSLAFPE